ncbi:MAG: biotin--[acetyl-CoA-carboxylase] ligase [Myxococcales bacterium]|nr:MAG: biotin--[acetyl-CoA-carboxylase] ligase [Myxococcales bacterium]
MSPKHVPPLQTQQIKAQLKSRELGHLLELYEEVNSTNDVAKEAALNGAAHGLTIVAETQRAGRGRRGRIWTSPSSGDLYMSIVWRKKIPQAHLALATLCTGLGVASAIEKSTAKTVQIKWPNDILIAQKKAAGILVEGIGRSEGLNALIIGIGVNVHREAFPADFETLATSLCLQSDSGSPLDRGVLLCDILKDVEDWLEQLCSSAVAPILESMQKRLAWRGQWVLCDDVAGQIQGLDDKGALILATESGPVHLLSGSVRLRERDSKG